MRVSPVVIQVSTAAAFLGLMLWFAQVPTSPSFETQARVIEQRSELRFQTRQGLSPCGPTEQQVLARADIRLLDAGHAGGDFKIVVLHAFEDVSIVTLGPESIASYRIDGATNLAPPTRRWLEGAVRENVRSRVDPMRIYRVTRTLDRAVTHAASASSFEGLDGAAYYVGRDSGHCAFTDEPRGAGIGALVRRMAEAASHRNADVDDLLEIAAEIDSVDASQ